MILYYLKRFKPSTIIKFLFFFIFFWILINSMVDPSKKNGSNSPPNERSGQNINNGNDQSNTYPNSPTNENYRNNYNTRNYDQNQDNDFTQTYFHSDNFAESSSSNVELVSDKIYFFNRLDDQQRKYDAEDFVESKQTIEFFLPKQEVDLEALSTRIRSLQRKIARVEYSDTFCHINIDRNYLLNDSKTKINNLPASFLKNKLMINFDNEPGIDAGGLKKEWFNLVVKEALNCDLEYFCISDTDARTIRPSSIGKTFDTLYKDYYKFIGRLIGLALLNDCKIDAKFDRPVFKYLLNQEFRFEDLEDFDIESYNSLSICLRTEDIKYLYFKFVHGYSIIEDNFEVQLVPNGDNIDVTEKNKKSYIQIKTEMILYGLIKDQLDSIKEGLYEIIRPKYLKNFTAEEFEIILCGVSKIDIKDWKANTIYANCQETDRIILWFWRAVESFSEENKRKLLQFVTGSDRVPYGGFANLTSRNLIKKFTIYTLNRDNNRLPSSHTCENTIDIPEYDSYEILQAKLLLAIKECSTGFGFA